MFQKLCYADIGNTPKQDRIKQRYEKTMLTGDTHISKRKPGRPPKSSVSHLVKDEDLSVKILRLESVPFDKSLCVLGQDMDGKIDETVLMKKAAPVVSNTKSIVRWNHVVNLDDAVPNNVKYHLPCWVKLQRCDLTSSNDTLDKNIFQETENCSQIAADLELISKYLT